MCFNVVTVFVVKIHLIYEVMKDDPPFTPFFSLRTPRLSESVMGMSIYVYAL
jgi:hypothetical protein